MTVLRQCVVCDEMFYPVNSTHTLCSDECKDVWARWKRMYLYHKGACGDNLVVSGRCGAGRIQYKKIKCPHCKTCMEVLDDSIHQCPVCKEYMIGPVPGDDVSPEKVVKFDDLILGVDEFKRFFKLREIRLQEDDERYRRSLHGESL